MIRSKAGRRKRLLVSTVTAAVMALGVLVPTASAEDNNGTVAKGETRATPEQCDMYKKWYNDDLNAKPPNPKGAEYTKNLADRRGCKWAEAATAPSASHPAIEAVKPWAEATSADGDLTPDRPWVPRGSISQSVLSP